MCMYVGKHAWCTFVCMYVCMYVCIDMHIYGSKHARIWRNVLMHVCREGGRHA